MSSANLKSVVAKSGNSHVAGGRRKISVKNVKLSDMEAGYAFKGIFRGTVAGAPYQDVDKKSGEIITKQLQSVVMEDLNGDRTAYLADKGLLEGLSAAMVKENDAIEVVKLEKVQLSKGRTMNQYDIFALESLQ